LLIGGLFAFNSKAQLGVVYNAATASPNFG
jgi:hypothetical protein